MNPVLVKVALFIRDLLSYNEQLIKIGRQNSEITDFDMGYIGVDTLGQSRRLATSEKYAGDVEVMTHSQRWSAPIVLSFYGVAAWDTASDFCLLIKSQIGYELQQSIEIGIHQVSALTDVKILTGQQYGERVEINFNVHYTTSIDVDILRIDTAQIDVLSNK
jgi:hypothetical protein